VGSSATFWRPAPARCRCERPRGLQPPRPTERRHGVIPSPTSTRPVAGRRAAAHYGKAGWRRTCASIVPANVAHLSFRQCPPPEPVDFHTRPGLGPAEEKCFGVHPLHVGEPGQQPHVYRSPVAVDAHRVEEVRHPLTPRLGPRKHPMMGVRSTGHSGPCGDLRSNHGGAALRHRFEGQFGLIVTRRRWCSSPPPHLTTGQIIASFRDVVRAVGRCDSLQRARGACPSSRPHAPLALRSRPLVSL